MPSKASIAIPPPTPNEAVSAEVKKLATTSKSAAAALTPSGRKASSTRRPRVYARRDAKNRPQASVRLVNWPAGRYLHR
jgi:hypothetical protein